MSYTVTKVSSSVINLSYLVLDSFISLLNLNFNGEGYKVSKLFNFNFYGVIIKSSTLSMCWTTRSSIIPGGYIDKHIIKGEKV